MLRFANAAGFVTVAGLLMSGCSGGAGVTDMLGMGKNVPDEREVRTHQVLAMPPTMNLPPPSSTPYEGTPNAAAAAAESAVGKQALSSPPDQMLQNATRAPSTPPAYSAPAPVQQAPVAQAPAVAPIQTAAVAGQDVYQQYGISKVNPDGTPKSEAQLNKEMREKHIAAERAKNPNYGSIFNIGNIFSD